MSLSDVIIFIVFYSWIKESHTTKKASVRNFQIMRTWGTSKYLGYCLSTSDSVPQFL